MTPTAQEEALKLIKDLQAILPANGIVAALRQNFDRMSTQIEVLQYGKSLHASEPGDFDWLDTLPVRLTGKERALLLALKSAGQRGLTKDGLLMVMYSDKPDNSWPEPKIADVFVSKIRTKFYAARLPNPIMTVWGRGYEFARHPEGLTWEQTYTYWKSGASRDNAGSGRPPKPKALRPSKPKAEPAGFKAAEKARAEHGIWRVKPIAA